jgi:hypothetical protein
MQYMLPQSPNGKNNQYASSYQNQDRHDEDEDDQLENDSKEDIEQEFEFERITKKQTPVKFDKTHIEDSANSESTNSHVVTNFRSHPASEVHPDQSNNFRNQRQQQHDLLFASHSATVTLSGPSGPFKAIICHDCDRKNEDGQVVPHSVSFSAIKNWNVGRSKSKNQENVQNEETNVNNAKINENISDNVKDNKELEQPEVAFDEEIWAKKVEPQMKNLREPSKLFNNMQPTQNTEDKNVFGTDITFDSKHSKTYEPEIAEAIAHEPSKTFSSNPPLDYISNQPKSYDLESSTNYDQKSPETYNSKMAINTELPNNYNSNNMNYPPPPHSQLQFNAENMYTPENTQIQQNSPPASNVDTDSHFKSMSGDQQPTHHQTINPPHWRYLPTAISNDASKIKSPQPQRKPIFTDLIKVPYDALNAPQDEYTQPKLPIQINQQQTFNHNVTSNYQHFQQFIQKTLTPTMPHMQNKPHYHSTAQPEQNYEVDEAVSVLTNGKAHGIQTTTPQTIPSTTPISIPSTTPEELDLIQTGQPNATNQQNLQDSKFGYVVEGRDYRKYRVEEKTPDGFIVGEYGVVSNNDGSPLQGVRYTASSDINPRLIYDALLKFLSL